MKKEQIEFGDFMKVDMCVGTVLKAYPNEHSHKPSIVVEVDFGEEIGLLKSSAQITDYYTPDALIGRQIVAVINFPPKQIARTISQFLVLGAVEEDNKVVLMQPERKVKNGTRIS